MALSSACLEREPDWNDGAEGTDSSTSAAGAGDQSSGTSTTGAGSTSDSAGGSTSGAGDTGTSTSGAGGTSGDPVIVPLVEYRIAEAGSGQGVSELVDTGVAPTFPLPLDYPSPVSPVYAEAGGGRYLRFSGMGDTGGAIADIGTSKVSRLHQSQTATLELKYTHDTCLSQARIFGMGDGDLASSSRWFASRVDNEADMLVVTFAGRVGWDAFALEDGGSLCPAQVPRVVHWVIETTAGEPSDRVRAYIDGDRATLNLTVGDLGPAEYPELGGRIDIGDVSRLYLGRPHTGFRTSQTRIWYAAAYDIALEETIITARAAHLLVDDDADPG